MPVHDIISVRLGETFGEDLEALATVAGTRDRELALTRDAFLVLDLGHEPGRIRLARVHGHGKAERRRLNSGDLAERFSLVGGDKNSVVMLHPHALRRGRTLDEAVHILPDRIVDEFG